MMHTVIEALEGKKAVIFGSDLEMRTSKIMTCENVILTQIQHRGQRVQEVLTDGLPNSGSVSGIYSLAF